MCEFNHVPRVRVTRFEASHAKHEMAGIVSARRFVLDFVMS